MFQAFVCMGGTVMKLQMALDATAAPLPMWELAVKKVDLEFIVNFSK